MRLSAIYERSAKGIMRLKDIKCLSAEYTPTNVKYMLFNETERRNLWVTYH